MDWEICEDCTEDPCATHSELMDLDERRVAKLKASEWVLGLAKKNINTPVVFPRPDGHMWELFRRFK
jgi:hypothetical protein